MKTILSAILLIGLFCTPPLLAVDDAWTIVRACPEFAKIADDADFNRQFQQYMQFSSDKSPDGKMVFAMMNDNKKSLDVLATIFHEQVELAQWLKLGHRFADILTVEYNQKHYMEVYPVAHRAAVIEELALLQYFAHKKCGFEIPEIALNLVSPMIEKFGVSVERFQSRLKFNLEYNAQLRYVSDSAIAKAMQVFESGGYQYKKRDRILAEATAFAKKYHSR
jgi:hypothetical protein